MASQNRLCSTHSATAVETTVNITVIGWRAEGDVIYIQKQVAVMLL